MRRGFAGILIALWAPLASAVLYLIGLTVAAARPRRPLDPATNHRRFTIVVPAHDEEQVIEPVLRRLMDLHYPPERFQVVVIADNCTDGTADLARSNGARVLERFDPSARGKGGALAYAFEVLRSEPTDAYVILDADSLVDPELLNVFNQYLEAGYRIVQAHYDVLNPFVGPRSTLAYVAFTLFNYVRPLGRRALSLSIGLKGNGMCFAKSIIDRYSWNAYSLAEDIEYTTTLLTHGEKIIFAPEARVAAQMPVALPAATTQRIRWEAGRMQMARRDGLRLLRQGVSTRNAHLFDWGMDLMIPPLAALAMLILIGTSAAGIAASWFGATMYRIFVAWCALAGLLGIYVLAAMRVARLPWRAYKALASVPIYIGWKVWLYVMMAIQRPPVQWIRTERTTLFDRADSHTVLGSPEK